MMFKPKRLHPIFIFIKTGQNIKRFLFWLIPILLFRHAEKDFVLVALISTAVILIVVFLFSLLAWYRYTYRMENEELRIEYGILIRKKRYIPVERVQSLDITEGILQQMFGLVKVKVETAGGDVTGDAEVVLHAISKQEANVLQGFVTSSKELEQLVTEKEHEVIYQITSSELLLLSLTSGGIGVVVSAVLALSSQLDNVIPYNKIFGRFEHWAANSIVTVFALVFIGFVLVWIIALLRTMLKYASFTVIKTKSDLIISQGFLEKRQMTIPINRIQAIRISENIIRQLLGFATVHIESAGGSITNLEGSKVVLLPMVRLKRIPEIIEPNLNEYKITGSFHPAPKQSLVRYIIRSWFIPIPIVVVSLIFLKLWGLLSFILLGVMTIIAVLKYKSAGWNIDSEQLCLRFRGLSQITTVYMKRNKIQSLELRESFFQRKKNLGSIEAFVKSGAGPTGGTVVDLAMEDIQKIYHWFSRTKKGGLHY